jgi:hypothetical protein
MRIPSQIKIATGDGRINCIEEAVPQAADGGDMLRYLVVANQTLVTSELVELVLARLRSEDAVFHIVVPATRLPSKGTWTGGKAHAVATERLEHALKHFAELGVDSTGEIGDANPMAAISDCLLAGVFDRIILSTLPPGRSEWLRQDLPSRVRRAYGLPVDHVTAERMPVT